MVNSIYSVTGEGTPPENFAPGTGGFAVPESYFTQGDATLAGVWNFLGQQVLVSPSPETCSDRGIPGSCTSLDPNVLKLPFNHTRGVITKLARAAILAARKGTWKGANGKFSIPFIKRGARALARMNKAIKLGRGQAFICPVPPSTCILRTVPKIQFRKAFRSIFAGPTPQGLQHLLARSKKEARAFEAVLRKVPDEYVFCP
jgi:hypothetical protein